jgi:hypothetical protein
MPFLQDLMDSNESLECLDFVGENWLSVYMTRLFRVRHNSLQHYLHFHASPERLGGLMVPRVHDTCSDMFP